MSHAILPPTNGIPVGLFGESSRAGNQSEKEPSALSHFLSCISESTAWKAITRLKEACISRLNPNSNLSTSDVNVSFADLRKSNPDLAIITPCLSRGRAVVSAVKSGHYDILEGLLRNDTISIEDRGTAVVKAAENDRDQVIDTLLRDGPISIEDRGRAVVKASSLDGPNTLRIIEMLLENGPISENHQLLARLHNLERIRKEYELYHLNQFANPNGFAAEIGRRRLAALISVQELLRDADISHVPLMRNCTISDVDRGRAVVNAVEYGYYDIVATLLQNGQISDLDRGKAVMYAAGNGRIDILEMLLQNGAQISNEHRGWAVMNAAQIGRVNIIERLLQDGAGAGIPLQFLHQAIWFLNERQLVLPALNALVNDAPQPNDYRHGINVHAGSRDNKTRAALELLWERTNGLEIQEPYQNCISYLQDLPESDKKTLALKALLEPKVHPYDFPPLLDEEGFSCNGFSLTGKELIGRLWGFISGCDEKNQNECKEGMLTALSTSFEGGNLVCNQGKTQRLLIAVLQGRLKGVQIDDLAPVLSPDQALGLFFADERRRGIQNKQELLREANRFLEENPIPRETFMAKLKEFLNLREPAQEE